MSYADEFPEHSRTSCSDDDPCNSDPKGHYCWRCNALLFDRYDALLEELKKHKRVTFMLAFPHLHSERDPGYMDHSPMETCRALYDTK